MKNPEVSLIIPVFKFDNTSFASIVSLQNQTFSDFEIILICDGNTFDSSSALKDAARNDARLQLRRIECIDEGKAYNYGLSEARGKYVVFLENDDLYSCTFLEKLHRAAESANADITACNFTRLREGGDDITQTGIHPNWLSKEKNVFHYQDCPDYILRIASSMLWNKMFRNAFIRKKGLLFSEGSACYDLTFTAISMAVAERITFVNEYLVRHRFTKTYRQIKSNELSDSVFYTVGQIRQLPYSACLESALLRFVIDNFLNHLKKTRNFSDPEVEDFYQMVHETFGKAPFAELDAHCLHNNDLYREFLTVQKHDYPTMKHIISRRLIVSLTSYPKRIGVVAQVLNTIYAQTRKADEIILWLAEEQFPGKEADLPDNLRQLISDKRLTVRWCDDLKGHKKYFYALQEYQDDIVVTIDDDLLYPQDMLASLYKSYLLYPDAVSTLRAHLILVSEQNQILPYREWIHETDACIHKPCMQLMASGGAGDLYPPGLYRKDFFDREAVLEYCLWADNLWVKAMQLVSDVPVVLVRPFEPLRCVEEAQEETLYQINGGQNQYDTQMERIGEWLEEKFGPNILVQKLTKPKVGVDIHTIEAVSQLVNQERTSNRWKRMTAEKKLQNAENDLKRIQDRLRGVENQLQQTEIQLKDAQAKQTHTEKKLKQTEDKLRQVEESKPIKKQLGELGRFLRALKAEDHSPLTWWIRYLIYILAWIPEAILAGMMFYLENGFRQTVKYVFIKLSGRRK